jgi:argininosuccinate lyase
VRQGVPFNEAHERVGKMVRRSVSESRSLNDVVKETLGNVVFDARASVRGRAAPGPGEASIEEQLNRIGSALDGIRKAFG